MPSFEHELIADVIRFKESIARYTLNPNNQEAAEMLCICSRSVAALHEELCVWDDRVNEAIRTQVIDVLKDAERSLKTSKFAADDPRSTYLTRIRERIVEVQNFSLVPVGQT
jgi:hypothetical protein